MSIEPDTKDWTWVLDQPCDECGADVRSFPRDDVGRMIRDNAASWQDVLARPDARERRVPDRWSPLEYGCHVRDALVIYDGRLGLMLTEDGPLFENWDQDRTAIDDAYADQDPAAVARELDAAAQALAARFDSVRDAAWDRPGERSDGASFTVETFARYFIHDPIHHLADVRG